MILLRSSLAESAAAAGDSGTLCAGENTEVEPALDRLSVASALSFRGDAGGVGIVAFFFARPDLNPEAS